MYILYIDESGTINSDEPFTLGYMIVSLEQSKVLEILLEDKVKELKHNNPRNLELHANPIRTGKGFWRSIEKDKRFIFLKECLAIINNNVTIANFMRPGGNNGIITTKQELVDSYLGCILDFKRFLIEKKESGIIISDKNSYEFEIQQDFKQYQFDNIAETILFMDSRNSRCLQAADLVSYSLKLFPEAR